jgi:hypothetical protein
MLPSGAKEVAEKGLRWRTCGYELLQGLKPDADLIGFIGPAKAVPLLQSTSKASFSAACEAHADSTGVIPG